MRSIIRLASTLISIFCLAILAAAQNSNLNRDISLSFSSADVVRIVEGTRSLNFRIADRSIRLELMPHDLRTANFRSENTGASGNVSISRSAVNTFIGKVNGNQRSNSRINIISGKFEGYFEFDGTRYFVEPADKYSAAAASRQYVVYRLEDILNKDDISCGSYLADKIENGRSVLSAQAAVSPSAPRRIEIATDADFEYVNTLGGITQANDEILGILNTIEGLYSNELNLSIAVTFQHSWTTADPFAGANTELTVRNFQAYWNANFPISTMPRDTAHLFSGKNNLLSQGWAFIGVICNNPAFAYGMSGYINWSPGRYLITGHELAHNLGANHAETSQNCGNSLMNAQLTGGTPLTFCQFSRDEVSSFVTNNASCVTSPTACQFDFDGDSKTDISIFRPVSGEWWYLRSSDSVSGAAAFGNSTDKIVPADYTGDGKSDIAIWRPSSGFWYVLRSEDQSFYAFPFGANGDTPVPGDFDADGKSDAAVYRPASSTWFINHSGGVVISQFGVAGDVPVTADYDGDGKSDIAIYRPTLGQWWIQRSSMGLTAFQFGTNGDRTVSGDYTGDGKADVAVWRQTDGSWSIMRSEDGSFYSFPFGAMGDFPASGDYDGDGRFDAAVFRPSTSTWFVQRSTAGTLIQQFGVSGDLPVANAYVR